MDRQAYFSLNPWWEGESFKTGFPREDYLKRILARFDRSQIEIVVGSRRVGKTTFLKQIIKRQLEKGVERERVFYLSCDHPQAVGLPVSKHLEEFRQIFSLPRDERALLFLDEVQETPNWEIELKSLYDTENLKIVCSGSTSALVKSHGGKLTGRQVNTVIYPLGFSEFLTFRKIAPKFSEGYLLENYAEEYLQVGGYPENVLKPSTDYLNALLDDIFLRDLIRLYPIKNLTVMKDLFVLLTSSVGTRVSFNKLANTLEISVDTVKRYIEYLESVFLVKKMTKWSTSHRQRVYAPKKIYLLDTGLKTLLTGEQDLGFKAENAVFTHFLRTGQEVGYFAESQRELDFVAGPYQDPQPVEAKYVEDLEIDDKRLLGLKLFLKRFPNVKKARIVTKNVARKERFRDVEIELIPLWQFLLRSRDTEEITEIKRTTEIDERIN